MEIALVDLAAILAPERVAGGKAGISCDDPAVKWSESLLTALKSQSYMNALKLLCTSG
jgi:hypothetical protein